MKLAKKLLAITVAVCFSISSFSTIHSHALEREAAAVGQPAEQPSKAAEAEAGAEKPDGKSTANASEQPKTTAAEQSTVKNPEKTTEQTTGAAIKAAAAPADKKASDESKWYCKKIHMNKEHQKQLWEYCQKRKLSYTDMLALIYTESNFYEKCKTGKYYGYFQISKGNCADLAKTLKTCNKPLDGAININWGTALYSWILADKRVKGLTGKKQRDVALSIYQRGTQGYDKAGISTGFLKTYYKKRSVVCSWLGVEG